MEDPRRRKDAATARQLRLERAKRGLIAGYLHALSDRHAAIPRPKDDRAPAG
jgi:hypothetical protein